MKQTENLCSQAQKKLEEQIMWTDKDAVNNKERRVKKWESKRSSVYNLRKLLAQRLIPANTVRNIVTKIINQIP